MSNELIVLKFAEAQKPKYVENKRDGYVENGEKNNYSEYLLDLFNASAKHGSIVKSKSKYVYGKGFNVSNYNTLLRKVAFDIELFGGSYLEVIWSKLERKITSVNHIDFCKIRTNKHNTQFWYKEKWTMFGREKAEEVLAFNPNGTEGRQILFIKEYTPGGNAYPLPAYVKALNYIEADIEVSKHVLGNASTGFTPSKSITLTNGEPSNEEKENITRMFERRFTGSDGKKFILNFVNDASRKPIIEDLGNSDLSKEDFSSVNDLIQNNIFAAHEITSPSLFGIATPGKLGGTTELKDAYEIFNNTYVNDKQQLLEDYFNMIGMYSGVEQMKIIPVEPIGVQIPESLMITHAPKAWVLEKLNINAEDYGEAVSEAAAGGTNEALRSLTGRQHQQLLRIIRQVGQGKLTNEQARVMLKSSLGLTDEEVNTMLQIDEAFSSDNLAEIFSEYGESADRYHRVMSRALFSDMETFEEVSKIEANVLDLISKDKMITPAIIAKTLKVTESRVDDIIKSAMDKGLIEVGEKKSGLDIVITRKLTKPISEIVEKIKPSTRSYVLMYEYGWRDEIPTSERNTKSHPSRPFCVKLMSLNKVYSRVDIENISARLGYSVFDRQGGWWNNDGTNEPHCRHIWKSVIMLKK